MNLPDQTDSKPGEVLHQASGHYPPKVTGHSPPRRTHLQRLQVAARRLLPLDCLEQRLEVPLAEPFAALALDHFEEESGPVAHRLGEDLQ